MGNGSLHSKHVGVVRLPNRPVVYERQTRDIKFVKLFSSRQYWIGPSDPKTGKEMIKM